MPKSEKRIYTYDLLRREFSDFVSLQVWDLISTANLSNEGIDLLVKSLKEACDDDRQLQLISTVRERYYRLLAEKILQ